MKHLTPMVDFVLNFDANKETINDANKAFRDVVFNYAKFLKQPLQLGMFVPCDEKGNVLSDPGLIPSEELNIYRKAKERCLFEGWTYVDEWQIEKDNVTILFGSCQFIIEGSLGLSGGGICPETLEGLSRTELDLPLTPTALKQIYG